MGNPRTTLAAVTVTPPEGAGSLSVEQEVLELVEVKRLTSTALAEVRTTALALDKRAYTVDDSEDVWRGTERAKRTLTADEAA